MSIQQAWRLTPRRGAAVWENGYNRHLAEIGRENRVREIKLFISYSHRDQELRDELDAHLAPLKRSKLVKVWHDRKISPGEEIDKAIDKQLNDADIILFLVSAWFINSDYCWGVEVKRALARHEAGEARVIPVMLHPVDFALTPFAKLLALPTDAKPVSTWANRHEALAEVARGVRRVAEELREEAGEASKKTDSAASANVVVLPQVEAQPKAVRQVGEVRTNPRDGEPYVWIPPGTFEMGCSPGDDECRDNEKLRHRVNISKGFWIGQTPVTVGAYRRFAKATKRSLPPKAGFDQTDDHPVVRVTWEDARDYCGWAGGRLPTEAEWEYAARAGSTAARYGELNDIAWYEGNAGNGTRPVRQLKANEFGIYDVLGNVWEWCADWFDENYYAKSPTDDPQGPESGDYRVLRGGSWYVVPGRVRVSGRDRVRPDVWNNGIGFRCVREVIP